MLCLKCGGVMTVGPSAFPGFDLMACDDCGRPVKLVIKDVPRLGGHKPRRGDLNRVMRSARRMQQRHKTPGDF